MKPSVIILAYNSVDTLPATLTQAQQISDDLHVVDSFSTDATVALSKEHGAQVVQHAFDSYGAQRNWAIDNLVLRYPWQLHLDADERLTPELIAEWLSDRPPGGVPGPDHASWRHVTHLASAALPQWRGPLRRAQI
jgi:glycosyltransferase involved in cell wall biosynthesis